MKSISQYGAKLTLVLLAFVLVLSVAFVARPRAVSAAGEPGVTTQTISLAEQKAATTFWTPSAISNAKPLVMVDASGAGPNTAPAALPADALSAMGSFTKAGVAAANANAVARKAFPSAWQAPSTAAAADSPADELAGTSQTFTSYIVNSWAPAQTVYPHRWIGRLSFLTTSGTSYCSATAISGNNIVTAAHCIYDTTNNVWYTNRVFSPAYRAGNAPYGSFTATACSVLTAWVNLTGSFSISGWTKYDVAVCTVGLNAASQTLNTAVGFAGRQWNYGYVRNYFIMGYPWQNTSLGALPSAGAYLRTCASESFSYTTDTLGGGCNWGPGISGGPWLIAYAPPLVSGAVNSVNSGLFVGQMNLYGLRFTSTNIVPLCTARSC